MDDEGFVLVLAQDLVQKGPAGAALLAEHVAHAHAGIDQQAEGERQVGLAREVADRLRVAVFLEEKIVAREVLDDPALFVANRRQHVHDFDVDGDR